MRIEVVKKELLRYIGNYMKYKCHTHFAQSTFSNATFVYMQLLQVFVDTY